MNGVYCLHARQGVNRTARCCSRAVVAIEVSGEGHVHETGALQTLRRDLHLRLPKQG
jgi:hypothetical protein